MKSLNARKANVLVAVCLVLTACSGASESTDSSITPRTKNAALITEVAACTSGNIGPNGGFVLGEYDGKIVEGAPTAWSSTDTDPLASQKAAMDYASSFSLNGKIGWSIPLVEVYQALKDAIHARYGLALYWSSTKWTPTMPILMNTGGRTALKNTYEPSVSAVPLIMTPTSSAACSAIVTTTTSTITSTTTSSTTTSTIAPIATTTTAPFVPVRCTTTSLTCRIGDIGPGGGVVVTASEVRDDAAVSIRFTEIAPAGWDGRQDPMEGMRNSALQKVNAYSAGGVSWRVPTLAESRAICRTTFVPPSVETQQCLTGLGFGGYDYGNNINFVYWTNEKINSNSSSVRPFDYQSGGEWNGSERTPRIRPARSWDVARVSLTVPSTIKATTTTTEPSARAWSLTAPKLCVSSASCKLGDTGPGGGVIISVEISGASAGYVEMAPSGWANTSNDTDPLLTAAEARTEVAKYRGGGFTDWTMPQAGTIEDICHLAAGRSPDSRGACSENPTIGKEFGSGNNRRNSESYWSGDDGTAKRRTDFISGRNIEETTGKAYLRPVRSFTYVPPTTTTTIAKTCARGGKCEVGDVSPSGNLIISMEAVGRGVGGSKIIYTEIASRDWGASLRSSGTSGDPELIRAAAVSEASKYQVRGSTDWKVPTVQQMREVFVFFSSPKFDANCRDTSTFNRVLTASQQGFRLGSMSYWVIDPTQPGRFVALETASGALYYDAQRYLTAWGYKDGAQTMKRGVRPVREVEYSGPAMTVENYEWSPTKCRTTSPPTTTVTTLPAGCQQRGKCVVGDMGPHGGIIIAVNRNVVDGPEYTEMATVRNNRADCEGTDFLTSCVMREWDDGSFQTPFGFYPTESELRSVATNRVLRSRLNLKSSFYWTNRWIARSGTIGGDFTGDLGELAQSLEVQRFDDAIAVNVSTGSVRIRSIAYFRGVIRWKCSNACVGW